MDKNTFDILVLTGRPASGKSEIIHFLAHLAPGERSRFHVGQLDVLDDFPMLWTWFEEDDLLSKKFHRPRLHSDEKGYFIHEDMWHLLVERLSLDYARLLRNNPDYHASHTALIEFSRGSEHGGYAGAFPHLSEQVLRRAAILYVNVSFEESLRKNRRRFNPDRPDSILEHGLPDEKMKRLYGEDDFARIAPGPDGVTTINGVRVPYAVFENEDDVTTNKPGQLSARLEETLGRLFRLYR